MNSTLACVVLLAIGLAGPTRDEGAVAGETTSADDLPDLEQIQRTLTGIRGLEFKKPVPALRQSREDVATFVDEWIEEVLPADRVQQIEQGMHRLGMLTEPISLSMSLRNLLIALPGAYYDSKRKRIVFLSELPGFMELMATHEMVHALQDQHFDLETLSAPYKRIVDGEPRNEDGELALRCLVEGEATYIEVRHMMGEHLAGDPETEREMFRMQASVDFDDMLKQMEAGGPGADGPDEMAVFMRALRECPAYLSHSFHTAYGQGAYLVLTLRQHGGWAAVSDAFAHPSRSTEQALHPEKLTTDRDEPTHITFTMLESLKGTGWTEIDAAIHGEFYLGLMLRNFGCDVHAARRAAAGWDGDLYRAYRDDAGRTLVALVTTWDSEGDATQFLQAYDSILDRKYPQLVRDDDPAAADVIYDCGGAELGAGYAARRGTEVFVVEGADRELGRRILDELKGLPIDRVD
jgi:hypothetical protein